MKNIDKIFKKRKNMELEQHARKDAKSEFIKKYNLMRRMSCDFGAHFANDFIADFDLGIAEIAKIISDISTEMEDAEETGIIADRLIESINDTRTKQILTMRYQQNKTWENIAEEINYSVSQVQRIHKKAMDDMDDPYNPNGSDDTNVKNRKMNEYIP